MAGADSNKSNKKVARRNGRATLLTLAALPVALIALILLLTVFPNLSLGWQYAALLFSVGLLLFAAIGFALFFALRARAGRPAGAIPLLPFFAGAYLLPMLVAGFPLFIAGQAVDLDFIAAWVFLWQALALGVLAVGMARRDAGGERLLAWLAKQVRSAVERPQWLAVGLLAGLGAWLTGAFFASLFSGGQVGAGGGLSPALAGITWLMGITLAPWAGEGFYRGELLARLRSRLGENGAALAGALIYAVLLLRPLFILPAFTLGLANAWLAKKSGSLLPAILAHWLFNLLLLLAGWRLAV
jgi:membrane protease YdiL (CAAX protease family)